jgi:LysM repeat protein
MKKLVLLLAYFFWLQHGIGQTISIPEYIQQFKSIAIAEMIRTGVPASITLAQGIHESESGNSDLVRRSNNHFGIKCKSSWTGEFVFHDDDAQGECFRKYTKAEESYIDHSNFLKGSDRYAFLFRLNPKDYKSWAYGLKKAGYATNPKYPVILIKYIEKYNLQDYTLMALNEYVPADSLNRELAKESGSSPGDTEGVIAPASGTPDPQTETRSHINGLKAVWALKGTSLLAIASRQNIALSRLLDFNDLDHDGLLLESEWLYLERKHKQGNRATYTTAEEESLRYIAQLNGIQLTYLAQYNDLPATARVKAGTMIYLQPKPVDKAATPGKIYHEVQGKEGLYAISRKYQVSVNDIRSWNNLETDQLQIGQKLIIYK